jgi:SPP1 gp7 family putative phage head morphogenesis protein
MSVAPVPVWLAAAAIVGPERAYTGLMAHLVAGGSSDDWAEAFITSADGEEPGVALLEARRAAFPTLKETLRRWKERGIFPSDVFDALADEMKGQAGRLVDVWHTGFVEKVYGSLFDAMASGATLSDWIPEAQKLLDLFGADDAVRIFSGEKWSPNYADLVFRNAHSAAMAGGRYAEMFSREWTRIAPYWLYDAVDDTRTRPTHAALDGLVFRKDDTAARRLLPPSAHRCRCLALEYTQRDVDEGKHRITGAGSLSADVLPPRGWDADRVQSLVPGVLARAA